MSDVATVLMIADKLLAVFGLVRKGRIHRDEKRQEALTALYAALNETRLYISERTVGKKRNRKREYAIAELWSRAAIVVCPFDRRLADVCLRKSDFWSEVELWDDTRIRRNGIQLDRVMKRIRRLLLQTK